ncbi:hypothetical protein [Neobacillus sp. PS3-40]|uniref:hypothetical protein n=1 Tax=Neobacillus sp. PS3-40 TaxID=3070679 RepID=UPI0027E098C2|nr:hypothetical protein [Neobacillus sp. PS3-40]WML44090.1 hypothetical protein RCG20_20290 [Neobacillus sp. PS3-40]
MAEIIDLDLLVSEPISFKIAGEIYEIPSSLTTETVINLMNVEQQIKKTKDIEKILGLQDKMVLILFSQLNDVNENWVSKLSQTQKSAIVQHYKTRMNEINSNPNSSSLPSQE